MWWHVESQGPTQYKTHECCFETCVMFRFELATDGNFVSKIVGRVFVILWNMFFFEITPIFWPLHRASRICIYLRREDKHYLKHILLPAVSHPHGFAFSFATIFSHISHVPWYFTQQPIIFHIHLQHTRSASVGYMKSGMHILHTTVSHGPRHLLITTNTTILHTSSTLFSTVERNWHT